MFTIFCDQRVRQKFPLYISDSTYGHRIKKERNANCPWYGKNHQKSQDNNSHMRPGVIQGRITLITNCVVFIPIYHGHFDCVRRKSDIIYVHMLLLRQNYRRRGYYELRWLILTTVAFTDVSVVMLPISTNLGKYYTTSVIVKTSQNVIFTNSRLLSHFFSVTDHLRNSTWLNS